MKHPDILAKIKVLAKRAKKVAKGWKIRQDGVIVCKDGFCTLGALLRMQGSEKNEAALKQARKTQREIEAAIKRITKLASSGVHEDLEDQLYNAEGSLAEANSTLKDLTGFNLDGDKFPNGDEAAKALKVAPAVAYAVVIANDNGVGSAEACRNRIALLSILQPTGWQKWVKRAKARLAIHEYAA